MTILLGAAVPPPLHGAIAAIAPVLVLPPAPDRDAFLAAEGASVRCLIWTPFIGPLPSVLFDRLPALRYVASMGAGYEAIDVAEAARRGICVSNTPRAVTADTADTALYLILATVRRFPAAERYLRAGRWTFSTPSPRVASVQGKTLGIVGYGRIGAAIAQRAAACGLDVVYHSRRQRPEAPWPWLPSIEETARRSDILLSMLPGGEATRGLIGRAAFEALGPKGVFISVGRGTAVDEPALAAALKEGVIAGAGLDVYADEPHVPVDLMTMDNVVLLPHVGGATDATLQAIGRDLIENLRAFHEGCAPPDALPEAPWRDAP